MRGFKLKDKNLGKQCSDCCVLKFVEHISYICLKANRKSLFLAKLSRFISLEKRHILFKALIDSQLKYCPLVLMFHGRWTNHKINRLHECALRIVYNDNLLKIIRLQFTIKATNLWQPKFIRLSNFH